ncbi:TetR/AcrR family transcriptional regulator [Mesorhizobium sp. Z1-4]|uniref:TetR/AcrR family transcriptional regulator n=1 Tax=Mesorhizobium sp. Z1-4 TaxID=2448478 RepID=UPI000FDAD948|nr:TetR/AcrR family transcriptional regulator [Mesorhizobium sp. Z1-4]
MAHRPRAEMIAETRSKLISAARRAFGTVGYADASMDDFTAEVGLTRGAIYHHFGGKKGLLEAVVTQIDAEMTVRLNAVSAKASSPLLGFVEECVAYIEMALEPEIQRIVHRDGPAVLGDPSRWANQDGCIAALAANVTRLQDEGYFRHDITPAAAARLINGASLHAAQWIANSDEPESVSADAVRVFKAMLDGLRTDRGEDG